MNLNPLPTIHFRAVVGSATNDLGTGVQRAAAERRQQAAVVENVGQSKVRYLYATLVTQMVGRNNNFKKPRPWHTSARPVGCSPASSRGGRCRSSAGSGGP